MAKKITLKEVGEMLAHVVKHMATKDDIAELRRELKEDIAAREEKLTERIDGVKVKVDGVQKAIDDWKRSWLTSIAPTQHDFLVPKHH